jgi:small subunit ribosomal protein S9
MDVETTDANVMEVSQEPVVKIEAPKPKNGFFWGTGRRKSSVGRIRIRSGSGQITINGRTLESFFHQDRDRSVIMSVLTSTGHQNDVDVFADCSGGGFTGQAGAMVLGLSRALLKLDPQCYETLKDNSFLTRDARMKERKKYGQRGARRSFQFSKR